MRYIDSGMYVCIYVCLRCAVLGIDCAIGMGISMELNSEFMIYDDGSARAPRISSFYNRVLCFGFGVSAMRKMIYDIPPEGYTRRILNCVFISETHAAHTAPCSINIVSL